MRNYERLQKLDQAMKLIREVEFSYKNGDEIRRQLYSFVIEPTNGLALTMAGLRNKVQIENEFNNSVCGDKDCRVSMFIDEETLTFGKGQLGGMGDWEHECEICTTAYNKRRGV